MNGECVTMKNWRLNHQQRGCRSVASGDAAVVVQNAILDSAQRRDRLFPITRHHVECDLRVESLLWQLLKGKQVDGLLVQFVHSFLAMLRSRLENCGHNMLHRD